MLRVLTKDDYTHWLFETIKVNCEVLGKDHKKKK